jgi:hypothetical protein
MSRADPLAPLQEHMEEAAVKKASRQARMRLTLSWFMTILMLGWVSKYAYGFV